MANPFSPSVSTKDPYGGDPNNDGPSPHQFYITAAMNDTLPVATVAASKLPFVCRAIRCMEDGSITIQPRSGDQIAYELTAGQAIPGDIIAVSGVGSDTAFVGYA